ncbi:oligosaccharide flippase family protein [Halomicrobium katesii]|uniref:oligosaccharide flippase family protein n=1 Tax=Halomicrobium katesii TaxID=437163 RepID=UPI000379CC13|nr:oligosaccharide flippase family protein [Halomicrobium katesii]
MRIGQTSFVTFVSKFLASGAGFVGTIVFARLLGADVLGRYYLLLSIVAWLALAGTLGFESAIAKRLSEGEDRGAYKVAGGLCMAALTGSIVVVLFLGEGLVEQLFDIRRVEFVAVLLLVGVASSYVDSMLNGVHLVHVASSLRPVRQIVRTALQVGGLLLSFGLAALVYGYAAGSLVVVVVGLYFVGRPYRLPTRAHFESLYEYARYAWLGRIRGKTFNQADVLVLGVFVSDELLGVYAITWSLANFLIIFSNAISSALFPELSKLSAEDSFDQVSSLIEDSFAYAGLFTIPGLVGGVLLSDRLLQIYGSEFLKGTEVLWLLIVAVLVYGYQSQIVNALSGIDRPGEAFRVNAVLVVSNVVLNFALIWQYRILGAAIATATSVVLSFVVGYFVLRSHVSVSLPVERIGTQAVAAAGMGVVVATVERVARPVFPLVDPTATAALLVVVGALAYFALLWALSGDFRTVVRENAPAIAL